MSTAILFQNTRKALSALEEKFKCKKCGEFASSPVTLGGCEHIFCSQCCEDYLGSSCPVCTLRADVKDADVDRQLFNLASLCAKLKQELAVDGKLLDDYKENEDPQLQCTPNQPIPGSALRRQDFDSESRPDKKPGTTLHKDAVSPSTERKVGKKTNTRKRKNEKEIENVSKSPGMKNANKSGDVTSKLTAKNHGKRAASRVNSPLRRSPQKRRKSLPLDQTTLTQFYDAFDEDDLGAGIVFEKEEKECGDKRENKKEIDEHENYKLEMDKTESKNKPDKRAEKTQKYDNKSKTKPKTRLRHSLDSNIGKCLPGTPETATTPGSRKSKTRGQKQKTVSNTPVSEAEDTGTQTPVSSRVKPRSRGESTPIRDTSKSQNTPKGRQLHQQLKSQSPALNKRNTKGETPLQVAAIKNDIAKVKELLAEGANHNVRDNAGWTPLHEACNHGYVEIAKLLLDHGAMINIPGLENDTPLHDAINNGRVECVKLLVSRGASLTIRNMHGQTPMDLAVTDVMKKALKTPVVPQVDTISTEPIDLMEYQPPCLLGTGLSREEKVTLQKAAHQLQVKLVDEVTPEVTHIVTKFNKEGMCPRTIKIVHGILLGKWILNMEWLETCTQVGSLVCEEAFESQGTSLFPHAQAPTKGRMNRRRQLPALFDGCYFYFHGSFEYANPTKEDFIKIVTEGGGKLLSREPKPGHLDMAMTVPYHADAGGDLATCCVFIVHESTVKFKPIKTKYMCSVAASWLMDCVANFKIVPIPVYD